MEPKLDNPPEMEDIKEVLNYSLCTATSSSIRQVKLLMVLIDMAAKSSVIKSYMYIIGNVSDERGKAFTIWIPNSGYHFMNWAGPANG